LREAADLPERDVKYLKAIVKRFKIEADSEVTLAEMTTVLGQDWHTCKYEVSSRIKALFLPERIVDGRVRGLSMKS
jgi:hypothetical protein